MINKLMEFMLYTAIVLSLIFGGSTEETKNKDSKKTDNSALYVPHGGYNENTTIKINEYKVENTSLDSAFFE
tara:strand:- start:51 stop:266 length:216 start_codon:yes stop_codon:yes gene_type:complete